MYILLNEKNFCISKWPQFAFFSCFPFKVNYILYNLEKSFDL